MPRTPFVDELGVPDLRQLASEIETRDPDRAGRRQMSREDIQRLADLIVNGGRPRPACWADRERR